MRSASKPVWRKQLAVLMAVILAALPAVCAAEAADGYPYNAEETMYLAGVEAVARGSGVQYSLYDVEKDDSSELFLLDGEGSGRVSVYRCDAESGEPRLIAELEGVSAVFGREYEPGLAVSFGDGEKRTYAVAGDALEPADEAANSDEGWTEIHWIGDDQWADGSIIGVAGRIGDPGVKNDFYLSSNYEWLSQAHVSTQGESSGSADDLEPLVDEKLLAMFSDREKYQGEDIQRVRDYYDAATDWEARDAAGIEPARKYLDAAAGITSLSELTEFLTDPEINPFCHFLNISITLDESDTSHWAAQVDEDTFSVLPRLYHNGEPEDIQDSRWGFDTQARHVLSRIGYEDAEIERILREAYEVEDALLQAAWPSDEEEADELYGFQPYEKVAAACERFPLDRLLKAWRIQGGMVRVYYPGYLRVLDALYTEENLEALKSYLISHIAAAVSDKLDYEAAVCVYDPSELPTREEMRSTYRQEALSKRGPVSVALENAYMTYFVDAETRADLIGLAEEIRDTFREMLAREEWLSEEGRAAAIEKLDNMAFSIMAPDELIDSTYLAVDTSAPFLDNCARLLTNTTLHNNEFAGQARVKGDWRYDLRTEIATTEVNAFYYGCFNQFFVLAGFVPETIYRPDMPREEKLSWLGEIIGHELTHGFDPTGIQYDKDGNKVATDDSPNGWLPERDYRAFMDRAGRIADYFNGVWALPYGACPGELQWGEAAADIGGLAISLEIAKKTPGFDYDRFFRAYSSLWRRQSTLVLERSDLYDAHPLYHLRINVTVRQFDEFMDTYAVREGDGMYLAPEDRINIW